MTLKRNTLDSMKHNILTQIEINEENKQKLTENSRLLLNKVSKDIKIAKYKLSTLTTNGDRHTLLYQETDVRL